MKINAIDGVSATRSNIAGQRDDLKAGLKTYQNQPGDYKLANYDVSKNLLVKPRISFKGAKDGEPIQDTEKTRVLLEEIEALESELKALQSEKEGDEVKKARHEVAFCDWFNDNESRLYTDAINARDEAKAKEKDKHWGLGKLWHSGEISRAGSSAYDKSDYSIKSDIYYDYLPHYEKNKNIIENAAKSGIERSKGIQELIELIATKRKLLDYTKVPLLIDEYINGKFGLNSKLAGYEDVKQQILEFICSIKHNSNHIPSCVLLYGAIGTGKTTFLKCVEDTAKDKVEVVRFKLPSDNDDFMKIFNSYSKEAQERYQKTGKRTILLMDDAEAYFAKTLVSAMEHPKNYSKADLQRIKEINESKTNAYATKFKHILDNLSDTPQNNDKNKSAMTMFITTNYPHIIDDDLMYREGKMHAFHVGPADGKNLADITKFYFKQYNQILNYIKSLDEKPVDVQQTAIENLDNITEKGKENLLKLLEEGKINDLFIDFENQDFKKLTFIFKPNAESGAFTNDQIVHISKRAFQHYLENPSIEYKRHFINEMLHSQRAIDKKAYAHYNQIEKAVNLIANRPEGDEDVYNNVMELLVSKLSGSTLSESDDQALEKFLEIKKPRLQALMDKNEKGRIEDEDEAKEFEQLKNIFAIADNLSSDNN